MSDLSRSIQEYEFARTLNADGSGNVSDYTYRSVRNMWLFRVSATVENVATGGTLAVKTEAVTGRAQRTLFQQGIGAGIDANPFKLGQLNTTGVDIADSSMEMLLKNGDRLVVTANTLGAAGTLHYRLLFMDRPQLLIRG